MADDVRALYDDLAAKYHLIYGDWEASIRRQGAVLSAILERECGNGGNVRVLDCACGIGTQMLGLASRGFTVTGCDLSPASVERARREAEARGLSVQLLVADMTNLSVVPGEQFEAVICMDNALPHLQTDDELLRALAQIRRKLAPGKLFVASIRDYDELIAQRPMIQTPGFYGSNGNRRIVHQVWDWINDRRYAFHLYITIEIDGKWESYHYTTTYRAILRSELSSLLHASGFSSCNWLTPADSGFYQPIVLARAA